MDGSKYLVDGRIMMFHPDVAKALGLNEAIFLQQLHYWLQRIPKQYEERCWVYNSYISWQEQLDFWSVDTIKRLVKNLEEKQILLTKNFNKARFDKTLWYSIDYEKLNDVVVVANCTNDSSKLHQRLVQNATIIDDGKLHQPIPIDNNNIHKRNYNKETFNTFWEAYPKKLNKSKTEEWFIKNKPNNDLLNEMLTKLEMFKQSESWLKDDGKFIPYPTTWLNQKRWEDEIEQTEGRKYILDGNGIQLC